MVPGLKISESATAEPDRESEDGGVSGFRFKLAVLRYGGIVYRVAHLLLGDRHEAEDVSQETFLRYWQHGKSVERPKEWLLAVTRNACLDRLRRTRPVVSADDEALEPSEDRDPLWHVQQLELGDRLRAQIARLPEPQRSLVILFDVQGVDGAACGRILGLSTNQVKVYLHRARRRLRRALEESS
ncbi:MAG TPA: sigma-70 family RNA polymerase sigma factor [Gammaproteobacteria bacterium]